MVRDKDGGNWTCVRDGLRKRLLRLDIRKVAVLAVVVLAAIIAYSISRASNETPDLLAKSRPVADSTLWWSDPPYMLSDKNAVSVIGWSDKSKPCLLTGPSGGALQRFALPATKMALNVPMDLIASRFSPDGIWLLRVSNIPGIQISALRVRTGSVVDWTADGGNVLSLCWLSDRRRFVAIEEKNSKLVAVIRNTNSPATVVNTLLPTGFGRVFTANCVTPGGLIVASSGMAWSDDPRQEIILNRIDLFSPERVGKPYTVRLRDGASNGYVVTSRDGARVARVCRVYGPVSGASLHAGWPFIKLRRNQYDEIAVANLGDSDFKVIGRREKTSRNGMIWNVQWLPDGSGLSYIANGKLWTVGADTKL